METKIYQLGKNGLEKLDPNPEPLPKGQIFHFHGYGRENERRAIYDHRQTDFGLQYLWVNLDEVEKGIEEAYSLKPIEKKFGIGLYYKEGEMANPEEITDALSKALEKEARDEIIKEKKDREYKELLEKGKQIFEKIKPDWAKTAIIAEYEIDDCDLMTDYFSTKTGKQILLGFSPHKRNVFSELRKFAALRKETMHLGESKEYEHRENYAGGAGYYLKKGSRYSTGWIVKKTYSLEVRSKELYMMCGRGDYVGAKNTKQKSTQKVFK